MPGKGGPSCRMDILYNRKKAGEPVDRIIGFSAFFKLLLKRVYMKLSWRGENSLEKSKGRFSVLPGSVKISIAP